MTPRRVRCLECLSHISGGIARRAVKASDLGTGPYVQHQLVRIHLLAGARDEAITRLAPLLNIPYLLTPAWLRIDPTFVPIRGDQRFERLVQAAR